MYNETDIAGAVPLQQNTVNGRTVADIWLRVPALQPPPFPPPNEEEALAQVFTSTQKLYRIDLTALSLVSRMAVSL
jgi:hypothetical protein